MADLNPLKFLVAIEDKATGELNEIERKLSNLKEHTIKLKVEGKEEILSAFNIDKLVEQIQNAKRALAGNTFEKFSQHMASAAEAVDKLTASLEKFKTTLGDTNDLKGLAATIREINAAMSAVHSAKGGGGGSRNAQQTTETLRQQTEGLVKVEAALGRVRNAVSSGGSVNIPFLEGITRVGERNIQTLIKEQGHIERLIAIAKKSIDFGEGHPVMGMGRLRGDQMRNLQDLEALKKVINEILFAANKGDQAMIHFLNTSGSLRTTPWGKDQMGNDITLLGGHFDKLTHSVTGTSTAMRQLNKEMRLDVNAKTSGQQWADSMTKAGRAASDLETKLEKLRISGIRESATKAGINTDAYDKAIERIQRYQRVLEYIQQRGGHDASRILGSVGYRTSLNDLNVQSAALTKNIAEKERAANATRQLTADEQRLAQALGQSTDHMNRQSTLLSDLKSLATQYLGVWGGQQFLNNIIQIGGQLEMQRLSIGAILQNQSQANTLFNQIKGLATQSPFGVVQLDQMTKQLTAYGFKYHELFDMTKRLADISAATGTSVDRLALALGHVRSEAALSGYTLRQFAMGNVPLLQKLSEKLGKTTKEIRDMVRKKEIGYDDVVGILKDLTDEGGMFYNMQEVISQSVKAKFKNVKDAMDIMYGEMAEGGIGEALKAIATGLMEVTKNWKDAVTIIGTGAAVWGINRAAIMLYTQTLGTSNAQTLASIATHRQKEAALLRQAQQYRTLTVAEQNRIASSKSLTASERARIVLGMQLTASQKKRILLARQQQVMDLALAVSEKKLTTEDIVRQVALGKLSKAQARAVIGLADLSAAERTAAIQAINGTRQIGMFGMALNTLGTAAKRAAMALKSFLLNPAMLAMAGITTIVELWQRNKREMEQADELADSIYQHSQDAIRNTKAMMGNDLAELSIVGKDGSDINTADLGFGNISNVKIKFPDIDKAQMQQVMDEWITYIENYAVNAGQLLNNAFFKGDELLPLEQRFENLKEVMNEVALAQYALQDIGDIFANAVKSTDEGWFDDDVTTDIKDYDKKLRDFGSNVATIYRKYQKAVDDGIRAAQRQSKGFDDATKHLDTYAAKFNELVKNQEFYPKAVEAFKESGSIASDKFDRLSGNGFLLGDKAHMDDARREMLSELDTFYTQIEAELQTKGVDINKLTTQQQQALLIGYKKQLESIQGLSQETMNMLMELFAEHFGIELDLNDAKFIPKVNEANRLLEELIGRKWTVDIEAATNVDAVIDEARKKYKAAKDYFEKAQPILLKFGLSAKFGTKLSEDQIEAAVSKAPEIVREALRQALKGWNQMADQFNNAVDSSKALGFNLEDDKKKSGSKKSGSGSKAFKDEFAKRWDERIRIMKEAYDWYDKWEKKVGREEAIKEVVSKYGNIFEQWRTDKLLPLDFDVNNIENFIQYVEKIQKEADARYRMQTKDEASRKKYNNGEEALRVFRQATDVLSEFKFDNLTKAAEDFKSIIEQTINDLNERWDIFNTVRGATGNAGLAARIAGFGAAEVNARTSADAMRNVLLNELRSAGGEGLVSAIPLDIHIDEESLRTQLQEAIPQAEDAEAYKDKIDGLVKAYQEWQKLQQKVLKDDVSVFSNLIGAAVSYDAKVNKLRDDLQKQIDSNNALALAGVITPAMAEKANNVAQTKFDWETMKLSADYANIYNHAIAMSREEFDGAANAIETLLKRLRELELISDDDYLSERSKLDKARNEWGTTGFLGERGAVGQFISGGYEGLMNYYAKRRDAARRNGNDEEADHYGKLFDNMSKLSDSAKDVITAFQTLQSGLELVTNLFDSLGMEGAANAAGDVSGILGSGLQGAQALSALGPWGMAAGAALGLVSGVAQTHDKALERQIGKLREDVQKIEANTKLIEQARERTLGLDTGDLRRSYAEQYAPQNANKNWLYYLTNGKMNNGFSNKAQKGMYEYYSQNTEGSGYQQEYQNLMQQRQDYMDILDKQMSKKKKSNSDIEETKAKIAELDDQIRFFTMDLAKELFDIDVKGWADQLSDALASAFENGESMAKAYKETVTSILQSLAQKMMKTAYLEKMFENLQDKLFGENGVVDPSDMQGSMSKATAVIADFFGKGGEGEQTIAAATEFLTAFQRGLESSGLTLFNESGKTLSASVQGTSEETSDLLAAYVNALRQDVSINRLLLTEFVAQLWPSYIEEFENHIKTVARIDTNVQAVMEMMRDGRGAMYDEIHGLRSRIDNVVTGIESFAIK